MGLFSTLCVAKTMGPAFKKALPQFVEFMDKHEVVKKFIPDSIEEMLYDYASGIYKGCTAEELNVNLKDITVSADIPKKDAKLRNENYELLKETFVQAGGTDGKYNNIVNALTSHPAEYTQMLADSGATTEQLTQLFNVASSGDLSPLDVTSFAYNGISSQSILDLVNKTDAQIATSEQVSSKETMSVPDKSTQKTLFADFIKNITNQDKTNNSNDFEFGE